MRPESTYTSIVAESTGELKKLIDEHPRALVVLSKIVCPHCTTLKQVLATDAVMSSLAEAGVTVLSLLVDHAPDAVAEFKLRSVPMVYLYEDGEVRCQATGAVRGETLTQWVSETFGANPHATTLEAESTTPVVEEKKKTMIIKRNGSSEAVDLNKILKAIDRNCDGLAGVDPVRVATRTISGIYDGATTKELDELAIRTAALLIAEEPEYGKLAARLLANFIAKEVRHQGINSFSESIQMGVDVGLINERLETFVRANGDVLNGVIDITRDRNFDYFGLRTLYDRYLLRHPTTRKVIETPQQFFLRIASAVSTTLNDTVALYNSYSALDFLSSSPTLFNAGTRHEQMSSCYLLDSPDDSLDGIYGKYHDVARLSKFSGGIGVSWSRVRARGSLIKSTNGLSNGIVPWLKTLDSSVAAVNQGGKRKGAACVYLETWHADVEDFLELRDNSGDESRRTHNLNLANWVPDLFMKRVEKDQDWSLFDPAQVPHLVDLYGDAFEAAYIAAEEAGLARKTISARKLYGRMMRTLAETGNGWMTFKDKCNKASNQTLRPENVIHLSNLCTEILEVTSSAESAVCNLGSINLGNHITVDGRFNFDKLATTVRQAVRQLNRVIDLNFYPIQSTEVSNHKWRPVGLGYMGLQDVFFKLGLPFDSAEARELSAKISEEIYYYALLASSELALEEGPHSTFQDTRASQGELQFDAWGVVPSDTVRWDMLRERIKRTGLRNSLIVAIAPTATIASIAGCYECVEPQVSNLFKRETLSGDFLQINKYLVAELKSRGLWTAEVRDAIKLAEGSVQGVEALPEDIRKIYRTAWELPMRSLIDMAADRGAFIDQSASLNLFLESPTLGALSSMYMYAWKRGIKTTYYLRSRPATKIAKTTVSAPQVAKKTFTADEALACSLENPETCEACT